MRYKLGAQRGQGGGGVHIKVVQRNDYLPSPEEKAPDLVCQFRIRLHIHVGFAEAVVYSRQAESAP